MWRDFHMKQLKYQCHDAQNRSSGEIASRIFESCNYCVRPHGYHMHNIAAYMAMVTMYSCPYTHHGIYRWIFFYVVMINSPVFSYPFRRKI